MWKRSDEQPGDSNASAASPQSQSQYSAQSAAAPIKDRAIIGTSISFKGDITGGEDLLVQGTIEGKVDLGECNITIGQSGRVKADLYAKIISVEGEVHGNLFGEEKITIRKSGKVKGNLVAPRVSLEDGSTFKGSIDMDYVDRGKASQPAKTVSAQAAPEKQKTVSPTASSGKSRLEFSASQAVAAKGK